MRTFTVKTSSRSQMLDISRQVEKALDELEIQTGTLHVFVPHTTAGVTINENADPTVRQDIQKKLEEVIPWSDGYQHLEGNSAAHIKASIIGSSEIVIVENGRLVLGRWQSLFFCEFDGPRTRKLFIAPV